MIVLKDNCVNILKKVFFFIGLKIHYHLKSFVKFRVSNKKSLMIFKELEVLFGNIWKILENPNFQNAFSNLTPL